MSDMPRAKPSWSGDTSMSRSSAFFTCTHPYRPAYSDSRISLVRSLLRFFPLSGSEILPQIFAKSESNWAGGGR